MRRLAPLAAVAFLASCGGPPVSPARSAAVPVAVVSLPLPSGPGVAAPVEVSVPAGSAEVRIRLQGLGRPAVELTAELESLATGDIRRWPVDDAPAGPDGAALAVTVPVYALPAGEHVLTLWAGDADALRRHAFRVVVP